ncbi:MAG: hypothetical protein H7840_00990 [Alphaproteobacteria bacterium]
MVLIARQSEDVFDQGRYASATVPLTASPGVFRLPRGLKLAGAEFMRSGDDLIIVGLDGTRVELEGYFSGERPVDLLSAGGARIGGRFVHDIAGNQVAQAAEAIGHVDRLEGTVMAIRSDGTRVALEVGTALHPGDTLDTGSDGALSVALAGDQAFSMGRNGRVVLDVTSTESGDHHGAMSLTVLHGSFSFIGHRPTSTGLGESAVVHTPVATMTLEDGPVAFDYRVGGSLRVVMLGSDAGHVLIQNDSGSQILSQPRMSVTVEAPDRLPHLVTAPLDDSAIAHHWGVVLGHLEDTAAAVDGHHASGPDVIRVASRDIWPPYHDPEPVAPRTDHPEPQPPAHVAAEVPAEHDRVDPEPVSAQGAASSQGAGAAAPGDGTFLGGDGDDILMVWNGDALVDGGAGIDTAFFDGTIGEARIALDPKRPGDVAIDWSSGSHDTLRNVEHLVFKDAEVTIAPDQQSYTVTAENGTHATVVLEDALR